MEPSFTCNFPLIFLFSLCFLMEKSIIWEKKSTTVYRIEKFALQDSCVGRQSGSSFLVSHIVTVPSCTI